MAVLGFCGLLMLFSMAAMFTLSVGLQKDILGRITDCGSGKVGVIDCSAQAASYYTTSISVAAVLTLLTSPLYGSASDRFGRKPFVVLSMPYFALPAIFLLGTPSSLNPYYVSIALAGVLPNPISTIYAMVADVVPPERRLQRYAGFAAWLFLGVAFMSLLASVLVRALGDVSMMKGTVAMNGIAMILMAIALPETLPSKAKVSQEDEEDADQPSPKVVRAKSVAQILTSGKDDEADVARWKRSFYWLYVLSSLPETGLASTVVLYVQDRFSFTTSEIGMYIFVAAGAGFFWQTSGLTLMRMVLPNECRCFQFTVGVNLVHFMMYIFITEHWGPYLAGIGAGAAFLQMSILRAVISNLTDSNTQGRTMGILAACSGVCQIFGPVFCGRLFAWGSLYGFPELPFAIVAFGLLPLSLGMASCTLLPSSMPPSLQLKAQVAMKANRLADTEKPLLG